MEDTLRVDIKTALLALASGLNPYSNGRYSERFRQLLRVMKHIES